MVNIFRPDKLDHRVTPKMKFYEIKLEKMLKSCVYLLEKVSLEMAVSASAVSSEWRPNEKSEGRHLSMLMMVRINL